MKASESVQNYPSKLREYTNFSVRGIRKLCKTRGPRMSGSQAETDAQNDMREILKTCCDSTEIEKFSVHPHAFLGWVPLGAAFLIISAILNLFGFYIISLALTAFAFIYAVTEFILYKDYFDFLFPKRTSHNVYGYRKPTAETKRRIIFCGHTDSSCEWNYNFLGGKKLLTTVIFVCFTSFIFAFICSIGGIISGNLMTPADSSFLKVMNYVFLAFTPFLISGIFFCNFKKAVMGANDNLTGCYISMAVAKFLEDNDLRFENTEVGVFLSGSEEIGLRGAKTLVKSRKSDFEDVETIFVCIDTIRDLEFFSIYKGDLFGTVKNNEKVCNLLKNAGENAGIGLDFSSVYFGASDAAALTQGGLKAATLAAMDPAPARYYHTRLDNEENLDPKAIEACLNVALEATFLFDEKGI